MSTLIGVLTTFYFSRGLCSPLLTQLYGQTGGHRPDCRWPYRRAL